MNVKITINGVPYERDVEPRTLLAYFIREACGLTGTHVGCDTSHCGCCVVVMDGERAVKSCNMFAVQADGHEILTVEGLARDGELHPVQQAFIDHAGFQCAYCTPGFVLVCHSLLAHFPNPDDYTIESWLQSNICRCTSYEEIGEALREAILMDQEERT